MFVSGRRPLSLHWQFTTAWRLFLSKAKACRAAKIFAFYSRKLRRKMDSFLASSETRPHRPGLKLNEAKTPLTVKLVGVTPILDVRRGEKNRPEVVQHVPASAAESRMFFYS
ncbi:hypothetical protein Q1695_011633 [Nippostrongylus brasiliensis]|nr:hypothetical protein Q1695_011633 [Nippostrongylus brasiliensis]